MIPAVVFPAVTLMFVQSIQSTKQCGEFMCICSATPSPVVLFPSVPSPWISSECWTALIAHQRQPDAPRNTWTLFHAAQLKIYPRSKKIHLATLH